MTVIKIDPRVSEQLLWQEEQIVVPDDIFQGTNKSTLLFGVFYLDDVVQDRNDTIIKTYFSELVEMFSPWNRFYPWTNFNGVKLELRRHNDSLNFIFGSLVVENNIREEEALVVSILIEFSKTSGRNTHIKVIDTNGEFLLAEGHSSIPKGLEYPMSINRIWIMNGKIGCIPDTFKPNIPLNKDDALSFLQDERNKLEYLSDLEEDIRVNFLGDFPTSYLENLRITRVQIYDPKVHEVLNSAPNIASLVLSNFFASSDDCNFQQLEDFDFESKSITLVLPKVHLEAVKTLAMLEFSTTQTGSGAKLPYSAILSKILTYSVHRMLKRKEITLQHTGSNISNSKQETPVVFRWNKNEFRIKDLSWDELSELETSVDEGPQLNDLAEELETVLRESLNYGTIPDSEELENSAESEAADCLSDVSIDEEDFFEYFLVNALNISHDKLGTFTAKR